VNVEASLRRVGEEAHQTLLRSDEALLRHAKVHEQRTVRSAVEPAGRRSRRGLPRGERTHRALNETRKRTGEDAPARLVFALQP
jgi:hypothetical protein